MAIEAANIGANFSNYEGSAALGGGTLGAVRIDTRPIEDLARYTMLYNREEYLQRQKEAEKAAEELAKFTAIDLSTTIPKDAKILQEKYDKVIDFVKQNPTALQYKNRDKWLEYNKLKADLMNDTKFAAIRSVLNVSRKEAIAKETNEEIKKLMEKDLQDNINATDIRTPIDYAQKYDLTLPDLGKNGGIEVITAKRAPNEIFKAKTKLFDVAEAKRIGDAAELGFTAIDPNTTTGKLKLLKADENLWVKMADVFNKSIQSAKKEDNTIDESKIAGLKIMDNVNDYNKYIERTKSEIAAGLYKDALGNGIQFGQGSFRIEDYQPINWNDGISASELSKLYQYSQWAGDQQESLDITQTNELIEKQRLALGWANLGIEKEKLNKASTQSVLGADAVVNEVIDAIKLGQPRRYKEANGKWVDVLDIADPNLLKEFGTIDKDGNMINRPDVIRYDKAKNQLSLVYLQKQTEDASDGSYKKGDIIQSGVAGVTSVERTVPVNPTEWFGQISARKFSADDRGAINNFVDQIYNAFGRDLTKLADGYKGGATTTGPETKTTESVQTIKKVKVKGL